MPVIIEYLIKLNICLAVVYLFYQVLLRRLTFYNWNRWYLLGYTALSFVIPLINVMPSLQKQNLHTTTVLAWIPAIGFGNNTESGLEATPGIWNITIAVIGLVAAILLVRLVVRLYGFYRVKSGAQLISEDDTKIYQLNEAVSPFSFGNAIFINTALHDGEELEEIIRHEFVHVKQRHSIDILWCELLCILNWFNPFVWLLRYDVRQNLEFIADDKVLQNGIDKKAYQYLLLKVVGSRQYAVTNNFNFSSLKKRIAMMNTFKTARVHVIRFLFLLPVIAVLLLSFRSELKKPDKNAPVQKEAEKRSEAVVTAGLSPVKADTTPARLMLTLKNPVPAGQPLIRVDGVFVDPLSVDKINPGDIQEITVKKGSQAVAEFGEKGMNGVVSITTKTAPPIGITIRRKDNNKNTGIGIMDQKPLYIIDGEIAPEEAMNGLDGSNISRVDVLKGQHAIEAYGSRGQNGVVRITTKGNSVKENAEIKEVIPDRVDEEVKEVQVTELPVRHATVDLALSVNPNPVNTSLHLHLKGAVGGKVTAVVLNAEGKQLLQHSFDKAANVGTVQAIDVSGLPAGVYFLHVVTDGKQTQNTRFVKQ